MQKIKDFFKKVLAKLKSIKWLYILDSKEFTYFFPLTVLVLATVVLKSVILLIATGLFTVNVFRTYGKQ